MHFAALLVTAVGSPDFGYGVVTGEELELCHLPDVIGPVQRDGIRH